MPLGRLPAAAASAGTFVATEKVHGANFSVHATASDVHFAKRSGILDSGDEFYSFRSQGLDADLGGFARALFDALASPEGRARLLGPE